ncbi:MAG: glycosyl transferase [Candidatus Marinimicrobia bacterium]|nr:glycosyl transferase [Candidatus Neomarinimicrobiota bacterium]
MLSVIIPAYNEEKTIGELLDIVFKVKPKKEVIIINDGSFDNTEKIIKKIDLLYQNNPSLYPNLNNLQIVNKKNEGKGSALRNGFKLAKGEIILIQDADLELDPNEYSKLLQPFESMNADIVFGSRFMEKNPSNKNIFFLGNKILTKISNLFTGIKMTDMETCYKVFKKEIIDSIDIKSKGFCVEPELAAYTGKAVKNGKKFFEIPISYFPRTKEMGKKINYWDGVKAIICIIRYNLFS